MDGPRKTELRKNPREGANPLSALLFCWILPVFFRGYKRDLEVSDLTKPLKEHKSNVIGEKLTLAWERELKRCGITSLVGVDAQEKKDAAEKEKNEKRKTPSLTRAIVHVYGWQIAGYGVLLFVMEFFLRMHQPMYLGMLVRYFTNQAGYAKNNSTLMTQPAFIGGLISYYNPGNTKTTEMEAYLYAGGVVLCSAANVIIAHPYMMAIMHIGMKMRVAACSLIYRKALRLSRTALGDTTAGQVVNLLSNDVSRFDIAIIFLHYLWIGPLETIIITYLMYREVGISAVIGVATLLGFVPLQAFLGKRTSTLRLRTALRTDERVRLMNEIICGIQVIKMYAWEKPFAYLVSMARKKEIKEIRSTSYIRGTLLSFIMFSTRLSVFVSLVAYALLGYVVTAEKAFVLTSYYNILKQTMTVFFPQGIGQVAEAAVSIKRLQKFMMYDETPLSKNSPISQIVLDADGNLDPSKSQADSKAPSGNDISNGTKKTELSKKDSSEIFENGTGERSPHENILEMENAVARWTPKQTENTLNEISLAIKPGMLIAVIGQVGSGKSSLLEAILGELPLESGTLTVNGTISYASQEPWLFVGSVRQNILFGQPMDRERYKQVVRKCALERDFTLLPYGDKTIVGERGASLSGGQRARVSLARAVYRRADLYLLDDPLSAVDAHVGRHLFDQCISGYLKKEAVILVTHQLQYLKQSDEIIILSNGRVQARGTYTQLSSSGLDFARLLAETSEHQDPNEASSVPGSRRSSASSTKGRHQSLQSVHSIDESKLNDDPQEIEETRASGTIGAKTYGEYMKAGAGLCVLFILLVTLILAQIAASASDYFLTFWVNLEESRNITSLKANNTLDEIVTEPTPFAEEDSFWDFSRETCIYLYTGLTAATIIITLGRSYLFFSICMKASMRLHNYMFSGITRATMYFFNTNPSGRILNRFSKDMGSIDELLPAAMIDCLQIGLSLLGIIIVVAVVNYWLLIPTVLVGYLFYLLRNFYLATSRSVKRLEGTTRSPVFSHLSASLAGLPTIRAFGAQRELIQEFDHHQDLHSSAWYIFLASSRAFGFWLDLICVIYIAVVTLSFLVLGNENFGGNVGLAITQAIGLTGMFQWGMRQSAELENQMTSVERVLEYRSVQPEPELESEPSKKPPPSWPEKGKLEFKDLSLRYGPEEPLVLKKLNFEIKEGEKVGIVGRTGAGKSSLINAIFRLSYIDGTILLDDRDTADMGLHDLRSKVSIIPQEPVLFSGTMRYNLDPFDEYPDSALWQALGEVELKEAVQELPAGLSGKMSEGGSNFSVGQRQLVCLARAILRNNKVLVLDEATANVDPQTDALIQTTIRNKFHSCTVLTIAHRLNTVMDCDKVLVMDAGQVLEFGHPHELLQNLNGTFRGMVNQTGSEMLDQLTKIAEQSYEKQLHRD